MTTAGQRVAQKKLRFQTPRGLLWAEQLYDLPLQSTTGYDLDSVAQAVDTELEKTKGKKSFVDQAADDSTLKTNLSAMMEVVLEVIADKQAAATKATKRAERKAERKKLLDLVAAKKRQALEAKPLADLEAMLAAADAADDEDDD